MTTTTKPEQTRDLPNRALRNLVIRALLLEGSRAEKLAKLFDLDISTIRKYGHASAEIETRQKFDLPVPESAHQRIDRANNERMIREAAMLWRSTRLSQKKIAEKVGCSVNTLRAGGAFDEIEF
ncbi:hypothetical protein [Shewanella algae]|uniref:Uncharacterized protein n=1 Tax=Shewanella algae TaxID=38313 RepID=A0A379YLS7_9GAMM|nr:hypothetical protein [Shewanella algae]MBO2606934.1 hypothetical protein [Shewanella algae]PST67099.1 hypothetical protein AYI77_10125 [Shewanella algae]QTE85427.1 hypothetical protein JKK44_15230 [Shewanella algae]SUI46329.1 Uncharacterised protein [Shewanella algae]